MSKKLDIGSRVIVGTKKGEIRYMGTTKFSDGDWVGIRCATSFSPILSLLISFFHASCKIRLDTPDGKNDGTVLGVKYFTCEPAHGLFAKSAQVRLDDEAVVNDTSSASARLGASLERQ